MNKNGFTLIEVVAVLTILGVLLGFAVKRVDLERARLDSSVHATTLTLNAAQRKAALRQHDIVVAMLEADDQLRIHDDVDSDGIMDDGEDVRLVTLADGVVFGRGGAPAHPELGSDAITFGGKQGPHPAVAFHRNGSASAFTGFYLTFGESNEAPHTRAIRINRATGETRCYSYRTGSWEAEC